MATAAPEFDATRLAQLMALMDSSEDGEAQNAFVQTRRLLRKTGLRLVDVVETDAYFYAITKQLEPKYSRSPSGHDDYQTLLQKYQEMWAAGNKLADDYDALERRYNALAMEFNTKQKKRQTRPRRAWIPQLVSSPEAILGCVGVVVVAVVFCVSTMQWWTTRRQQNTVTGIHKDGTSGRRSSGRPAVKGKATDCNDCNGAGFPSPTAAPDTPETAAARDQREREAALARIEYLRQQQIQAANLRKKQR